MIIVIANNVEEADGKTYLRASHLVNSDTLEESPCPWVHPAELDATFSPTLGEWVLPD